MSFRPLINSVPLDVCLQFISERQYFKVQIKIYHYRLDNFFFNLFFTRDFRKEWIKKYMDDGIARVNCYFSGNCCILNRQVSYIPAGQVSVHTATLLQT